MFGFLSLLSLHPTNPSGACPLPALTLTHYLLAPSPQEQREVAMGGGSVPASSLCPQRSEETRDPSGLAWDSSPSTWPPGLTNPSPSDTPGVCGQGPGLALPSCLEGGVLCALGLLPTAGVCTWGLPPAVQGSRPAAWPAQTSRPRGCPPPTTGALGPQACAASVPPSS